MARRAAARDLRRTKMAEAVAQRALSQDEEKRLSRIGYKADNERAATCVIVDQGVPHIGVTDNQVEVMTLADALARYPWVQDLMFGLVDPEDDEHVKLASERTETPIGHFVRVHEGARVRLPIQLFTLIETAQARQFIHNVTVIEKGASVELVTGSATPEAVRHGHHVSISETYLREGAECRSLSVEQWGEDMEVHSFARTHVGKNARHVDNQIKMSGLRRHFSQSKTIVEEGGASNDQAVIFAPSGTERIMHSDTHLNGAGASAESVTRMVTAGGRIVNHSMLVGAVGDTKGYLGCDGLKLSDEGEILSTPSLLAKSARSQLSHEASIGMISQEKMAYLMATGMSEDTARDLIIQGFLHLNEQNMPDAIRAEVKTMIAAAKSGAM
jgi:Fe-S cluster assembly scaffold protein SufB